MVEKGMALDSEFKKSKQSNEVIDVSQQFTFSGHRCISNIWLYCTFKPVLPSGYIGEKKKILLKYAFASSGNLTTFYLPYKRLKQLNVSF